MKTQKWKTAVVATIAVMAVALTGYGAKGVVESSAAFAAVNRDGYVEVPNTGNTKDVAQVPGRKPTEELQQVTTPDTGAMQQSTEMAMASYAIMAVMGAVLGAVAGTYLGKHARKRARIWR